MKQDRSERDDNTSLATDGNYCCYYRGFFLNSENGLLLPRCLTKTLALFGFKPHLSKSRTSPSDPVCVCECIYMYIFIYIFESGWSLCRHV